MITDFTAKYGIKVQSDHPDGDSAGRDQRREATSPVPAASPTSSTSATVVALANTDLFAPYKVATWADIPDANKEADRPLDQQLHGLRDDLLRRAKYGPITKMADLLDPKYKGKVALNGDPLKASAGFNGVLLAALANGGSADNIAPGVDFFKKLADSGNLLPVDPNSATSRPVRPRS